MKSCIKIKSRGDFKNTETFLLNHKNSYFTEKQLTIIGEKAVEIFSKNTPSKTGITAKSWGYEIINNNGLQNLNIFNTHIENGYNIALLLDEGHALQNGKWVAGKHYIDKSIKEVFDFINTIK